MVSKELQDKFYAALESLKDGKNGYILEALKAGAKATFENFDRGYEGTFGPDTVEQKDEYIEEPEPQYQSELTVDDVKKLVHDPETEDTEDPEELDFDRVTGKSFPTYRGQFSNEDEYAMVAEAVAKLGRTIDALKDDSNSALVEAIKEGCRACFAL